MARSAYPEPEKPGPMFRHALIQGILSVLTSLFFASRYAWDLAGKTTACILNLVGIRADYVSPLFLVYIRLTDGTFTGFQVLTECSGLATVVIFSFIYTFTVGLLKGSILKKITWFFLSLAVGLAWNINRSAFVISIAYNFGLCAFSFTHYLLGPFIDFLWVVTMWSLGMSWLKGGVET